MDILVIGCGVSGLTTGLCLQEAGYRVRIWAKELPPNTTSNAAAAVWFPYKAHPVTRVTAWGKRAFQKFKELQAIEGSGVFQANVVELRPIPSADPWWIEAIESFRHARADELPAGYTDAFVFEAPVIDTRIYLDYLISIFKKQGGHIMQRAIHNLKEAFAESAVVVNCSGLGSRELVGDHDLHAARGQVVRIKHTGFRKVLLDEEGPNQLAYIVPRTEDIVLGGTFEEGNESLEIDPDQVQSIIDRCANMAPEFATITAQDILNVYCGLRPVRPSVRVESEH